MYRQKQTFYISVLVNLSASNVNIVKGSHFFCTFALIISSVIIQLYSDIMALSPLSANCIY